MNDFELAEHIVDLVDDRLRRTWCGCDFGAKSYSVAEKISDIIWWRDFRHALAAIGALYMQKSIRDINDSMMGYEHQLASYEISSETFDECVAALLPVQEWMKFAAEFGVRK